MIIFLIEQYSADLSQKSVLRHAFRILLVKVLQLEKDKGDKANNLRQKQTENDGLSFHTVIANI